MGRKISELEPDVARMCTELIEACRSEDIILVVYCTRRTEAEQAFEYAKGRRLDALPDSVSDLIWREIRDWENEGRVIGPGNIATHCHGPECPHVMGIAFDAVPTVDGKAVWDDAALWERIGPMGERVGLEWGRNWDSFPDRPHFQRRKA